MAILVAGGAGFIGCHLVRHYLEQGQSVLVIDNLCRGQERFLYDMPNASRLRLVKADLADVQTTCAAVSDFHQTSPISMVWHMAANSDIPAGIADSSVDLRDTFMTTYALLEAMKACHIKKIAFASSSAVYGDHGALKMLCEDTGPLFPISNYGAMKLASEAAISAAVENYLDCAWLFRFPNVVGTPATHGVIMDFIHKLQHNAKQLTVLGNGSQQKAYLHVTELVSAMLHIVKTADAPRNCFNIGPEDQGTSVRQIAEDVVARIAPEAAIAYGSESRGWVGDVPRFTYNVDKLMQSGFRPKLSSREAVQKAIDEIARQEGMA